MAEIYIDSLKTSKDKVFFPGAAVLSDKAIAAMEKDALESAENFPEEEMIDTSAKSVKTKKTK